ncbi:MAG: hypothetical protein HY420_00370 [Candidatus Kerfeldbacteria bacterium]|nr:hypothetical protein [Candidatus Kerfeldbacteria bacterium]
MEPVRKQTKSTLAINVHQVRGDILAIRYLQNADFHYVEGLFFRAKHTGQVQFSHHGVPYNLIKNRDLTYTVEPSPEHALDMESI